VREGTHVYYPLVRSDMMTSPFKRLKPNYTKPGKVLTRKVIDVIHGETGLSTFIAPLLHEIKYVMWPLKTEEEISSLDFGTFFTRMPPFEPIAILESEYIEGNNVIRLKGDYVWFVLSIGNLSNKDDLKKGFEGFEELLKRQYDARVKCDEIICGIYEIQGNRIILKEVIIPRIIYDGTPLLYKEVKLRVRRSTPSLVIYYGLHKVAKRIKRQPTRKDISRILREHLLSREKERGYSPRTLNYITTCYDGYVVATDPSACRDECDLCEEEMKKKTLLCKKYPGRGIYESRRKIFPKVYSEISVEPSWTIYDIVNENYFMPYVVMTINDIGMFKDVNGFVMYLDKVGKVRLELERKISTGFFNTNALITVFDTSILDVYVNTLEASKDNINIVLLIGPRRDKYHIPLYNLLVSKYLWYKVFDGDLELRLEINKDSDVINVLVNVNGELFDLSQDIEKLVNKYIKGEYIKEFREFLLKVITHTLAHVIYIATAKYLPESQPYVDYLHATLERYALVGVFENTRGGMLHIAQELAGRLVNVSDVSLRNDIILLNPLILKNMIESVITGSKSLVGESTVTYDNYEEELRNISTLIVDKIASKLREPLDSNTVDKIYNVIKEFYMLLFNTVEHLIKSGLYLDAQIFTYVILWHIIREPDLIIDYLSEKVDVDRRLVEDIVESLFEAELHKIIIELLFPDMCTDGCGFDLHLSDCHAYLEQPFIISRSLLLAFLEFLGVALDGLKNSNVKIRRIDCTGDQLRDLCSLARRYLYALTSELSEESIDLVRFLLQKNPLLRIILEVDKRLTERKADLIETLKKLTSDFGGRLELRITESPHHGKMLELDNLKIYTSWNFGTSVKPLQTYKAVLERPRVRP